MEKFAFWCQFFLFFRIQKFSYASHIAQYSERIQSSISRVCTINDFTRNSQLLICVNFRYSWGDAFGKERGAQFNMGENTAISSDMPFMVYKLLRRMSLDRRVNMKMHWKVVTLMVGLNDFCSHICHRKASPYWTNWEIEQNIIKTLRTIRDTMPRWSEYQT